jgi:methionine synthase II (cobalamin-independent)
MYKATADKVLPTSIIGSLPRPAWHTAQLGRRSFLEAMVNARWREQYEDAVSTHLRAQEVAGLDICTDGDAHYDEEIGGWSWQSYPLTHMAGFSTAPRRAGRAGQSAIWRDVEGGAAPDPAPGQVRYDHARAARRRGHR